MAWWEAGLRLLLAVVIGCVIGIEREKKNRPAGMRTHVLVCVGAALIAVVEGLIVADTMRLNLASGGNTGYRLDITRIGESFLVTTGLTFDSARDNVGVNFAIEPRFLPRNRLGQVSGARIPVAGAYGLE